MLIATRKCLLLHTNSIPFLDEICSYTLAKVMTNGTLFFEQVRQLCEKDKGQLLVGKSLDGYPTVHYEQAEHTHL